MNILCIKRFAVASALFAMSFAASAQKYPDGIIDKTVAVVGNEMIMISQLEEEVQMMRAYGMMSDRTGRCEILEQMMSAKLFLMQARLDSIAVNADMVEGELRNRIDMLRSNYGGDEEVEKQFGKPRLSSSRCRVKSQTRFRSLLLMMWRSILNPWSRRIFRSCR